MADTAEQPRFDLYQTMRELFEGKIRLDDLDEEVVAHFEKVMQGGKEALQARFDGKVAQERNAPKLADAAPDFELERLDSQGQRTGEMRRLSDYYDKPVALIFGSFT